MSKKKVTKHTHRKNSVEKLVKLLVLQLYKY